MGLILYFNIRFFIDFRDSVTFDFNIRFFIDFRDSVAMAFRFWVVLEGPCITTDYNFFLKLGYSNILAKM
jgi:hypothetical protein